MLKFKHIKKKTLMQKMIFPMVILIIMQSGLFLVAFYFGGIIDELTSSSVETLSERVATRKNYLENDMINRWSNIDPTVEMVNKYISDILRENNASITDISVNAPISEKIIETITPTLISGLRTSAATGIFIVFNGDPNNEIRNSAGSLLRPGIYLRDLDPSSNYLFNHDILVENSPSSITKSMGLAMDIDWLPNFPFSPDIPAIDYDFFNKPFDAAIDYPNLSSKNLGYWSKPFRKTTNGIKVITYSMPLRSDDGVPYAVVGIELSVDYIMRTLPYEELFRNQKGVYALGMKEKIDAEFNPLVKSGPLSMHIFPNTSVDGTLKGVPNTIVHTLENNSNTYYGIVQPLSLYNSNTPFVEEQWQLMGIVAKDYLLELPNRIQTIITVSMFISMFIGFFITYLFAMRISRPIADLAKSVNSSNPMEPVTLEPTHILEIDELSTAIEFLSNTVYTSASKLTEIMRMVKIPIRAFEWYKSASSVFCTEGFFNFTTAYDETKLGIYISTDTFKENMLELDAFLETDYGNGERIYKIVDENNNINWYRLTLMEDEQRTFGVILNITKEIEDKSKIEHERDYDVLSGLLNRRAFNSQISALFENKKDLGFAALIMWDIDNLKYINDTYGHDHGDDYICLMANTLKNINYDGGSLISRMSGDEFYLFLYGFESLDDIPATVNSMRYDVATAKITMPDGTNYKLRASAGIARYPLDSTSADELIRYADFAMYQAKHTEKGNVAYFNLSLYKRDSFLLHGNASLNKLIDEGLVEYMLQPIVNAKTGEIFAYEALMRPQLKELNSPLEVLRLARSQYKLYQIEQLTFFKSLAFFTKYPEIFSKSKLFINSIPNQSLSRNDIKHIEELYSNYLSQVVVEITEGEQLEMTSNVKKLKNFKLWNAQIAIDDYGSGFNGEALLLSLSPNYIKIDMGLVRNIDIDTSRQKLVSNILSYAKSMNVAVLAEGVETSIEMKKLIEMGVDYMQGYYIGIPSYTPQGISSNVFNEIKEANSITSPEYKKSSYTY